MARSAPEAGLAGVTHLLLSGCAMPKIAVIFATRPIDPSAIAAYASYRLAS